MKLTIIVNPALKTDDEPGQFLKFDIDVPATADDAEIEKKIINRLRWTIHGESDEKLNKINN